MERRVLFARPAGSVVLDAESEATVPHPPLFPRNQSTLGSADRKARRDSFS